MAYWDIHARADRSRTYRIKRCDAVPADWW